MESQEAVYEGAPIEEHVIRGSLGAGEVALLAIAAAAPLGTVVATSPIAMMFGNGAGLAGTYFLTGLLVLCFAIGYCQIIRAIPGGGAFYRYLSAVFGKRVGTGSAWVALASYISLSVALVVACAYFTDLTLKHVGIELGWKSLAAIYIVVVALLGRRNIDVASKVLVPLVLAEFFILFVLAVAIIYHRGLVTSFPYEAVSPSHVFSKGFSVSLMTVLAAFIGIESATLYTHEAKNPSSTIPKATIAAVLLVAIAYFLSIWVIIGDLGWDKAQPLAAKLQGDLILGSFRANLGEALSMVVSLMLCTSNLACYLALHNAATRYVHILSDDSHLPKWLAVAHAKHASPARASMFITIFVTVLIAVQTLFGVSAYEVIMPSALAMGTIGVISTQSGVAFASVWHFRRTRDGRIFKTFIIPCIGGIGFLAASYLMIDNYGVLTGSSSGLINHMPFLLIALFIYGFVASRCKSDSQN